MLKKSFSHVASGCSRAIISLITATLLTSIHLGAADVQPTCPQIPNVQVAPSTDPSLTQASNVKPPASKVVKDWNFIVYMAANNNLHRFGIHNLRQMVKIGSTSSINILVQIDEYGEKEVTRFFVEKENPIAISTHSNTPTAISGTPESLYDFTRWAIQNYPARHQAVVLWNHGSGIKDPSIWGRILLAHRDELFSINHHTGLMELNRMEIQKKISIFYHARHILRKLKLRGIAFNDVAEEYLTNQDLQETLSNLSQNVLNGKKIDLVCMDACHMAMVEIGSQVKDSVNYMVGSEEVEPGSGYNYMYLLSPFTEGTLSPEEFAQHAVKAYEQEYLDENADYTQSAVNLTDFEKLETNIKNAGEILVDLVSDGESSDIINMLRTIRKNSAYTTTFCDHDYIDFCHFYKSLGEKISYLQEHESYSTYFDKKLGKLNTLIQQGLTMIKNHILKNSSGVNLPSAYGLSIYFPEKTVHSSYYKTIFDQNTHWSDFLKKYIRETRKKPKKS